MFDILFCTYQSNSNIHFIKLKFDKKKKPEPRKTLLTARDKVEGSPELIKIQ